LYHELIELLDLINNQVPTGVGVPILTAEPHPYEKRYLHGRFAMEFMRKRVDHDPPFVWATRQGRQTRHIGVFFPVQITALYPAPSEIGTATGPVLPLTRAQRIRLSTAHTTKPDNFFGCFLSVGASTLTRNPAEILIIRAYMKYFTQLCMAQSNKSLDSKTSRTFIANLQIIDGVSLDQFFTSPEKAGNYLKNVMKKYSLAFDGESIIETSTGRWKTKTVLGEALERIVAAAVRPINIDRWNTMVIALRDSEVIAAESEVFDSVSILCGTPRERVAMDALIQADKFKFAVISGAQVKGRFTIAHDQNGTLYSGVVTPGFLEKMKAIRYTWEKNRRLWFWIERTEEEGKRAVSAIDTLIAKNSNKQAGAASYLR
jgi:hypothetical protein